MLPPIFTIFDVLIIFELMLIDINFVIPTNHEHMNLIAPIILSFMLLYFLSRVIILQIHILALYIHYFSMIFESIVLHSF